MMQRFLLFALLVVTAATQSRALPSTESYAVNFDRTAERVRTDRLLSAVRLGSASVALANRYVMYADLTPQFFIVHPGETVVPSLVFKGQWMNTCLYVDWNRNGQFDVAKPGPKGQLEPDNELVCFSGLTLDGGKYNSAGQKLDNLNVIDPPQFTVPADVAEGWYVMRWKVDWDSFDPAGRVDESNSIIANGGIIVDVLLFVTSDVGVTDYELAFADEFNQEDGSRPDPAKWRVSNREGATWSRWISSSPDVAFIDDGSLVCRAIPNPDTSTDNAAMLTGSVETRGLFSFTYGKVEVRLRTKHHSGNFPAAWMMPQPPCAGWPKAGEIDIFETIDNQNTAYHTVHSNWTYNLGKRNDPQSSFSESVTVEEWHTYGVEWLESLLIFTLDGKVVGSYARSTVESKLADGQWPYEHPFYIILNQSVGDGSWAKAADTGFTYETRFDYVRVYQRRQLTDAILSLAEDSSEGRIGQSSGNATFDLTGRRVKANADGRLLLPRGIYIRGGRKIIVR